MARGECLDASDGRGCLPKPIKKCNCLGVCAVYKRVGDGVGKWWLLGLQWQVVACMQHLRKKARAIGRGRGREGIWDKLEMLEKEGRK